jgi:hypothetical protein
MKPLILTLFSALILSASGYAQSILVECVDIEDYRDFSVNGMSEEKTLKLFLAEFEDELEDVAPRYLKEGTTLKVTFTDIDMAGEIQPWRNTHHADIRYIQDIYFPRLTFSYVYEDAEGTVLAEGEASISDMAFTMNTRARIRQSSASFVYELDLFTDWVRKTLRDI